MDVVDVKVVIRLTKMATKAIMVVTLMGEDNGVLEGVSVTPHWFWMLCNY